MVHADASTFTAGMTKKSVYEQVLSEAEALFEGQRNWVCNLANTASLLHHAFHALPAPLKMVNWTGFYVRHRAGKAPELILGPFMGKVACQTIAYGKGVCGTAAAEKRTQRVPNVMSFPGHIACDAESKSEIVVPILIGGEVVAIIDIDCAEENGFDETDQSALEKLASLLADSCDWDL